MASQRRAPLRAGFDRGAEPSADKSPGHLDVACARQMIEMRAQVAVGRAGCPDRVKSIGRQSLAENQKSS